MSPDNRAADERDAIVEAMLPHVPFDGWNERALLAGLRAAGMDADAGRRAFPGGMAEMAEHFSAWADRRMGEAVVDTPEADTPATRIAHTIMARLEVLAPHREAVRRLAAYLALTANVPLAARALARTVDAIWRAAGDASTDFSYYTKRALLAAVYGTTLLHWLADETEGAAATRGFLERRLEGVMAGHQLRQRVQRAVQGLPSPLGFLREFRRPAG